MKLYMAAVEHRQALERQVEAINKDLDAAAWVEQDYEWVWDDPGVRVGETLPLQKVHQHRLVHLPGCDLQVQVGGHQYEVSNIELTGSDSIRQDTSGKPVELTIYYYDVVAHLPVKRGSVKERTFHLTDATLVEITALPSHAEYDLARTQAMKRLAAIALRPLIKTPMGDVKPFGKVDVITTGNTSQLPLNWEAVSAREFQETVFFSLTPGAIEHRTLRVDDDESLHCVLFFYAVNEPQGLNSGVAIAESTKDNLVSFYRFGCKHKWVGMLPEQRRARGFLGDNLSVVQCAHCQAVDIQG